MAKYTRILSLDGGGLRGIIPAKILKAVEQKLQDFTGNIDAKIVDYFDLIAGTSAGGILTCLYLYPDPENPKRLRSEKAEACHKGSFYVDNKGFSGSDGPQMESAFFEVVSEVEKRYGDRIRKPETRIYKLPIPATK